MLHTKFDVHIRIRAASRMSTPDNLAATCNGSCQLQLSCAMACSSTPLAQWCVTMVNVSRRTHPTLSRQYKPVELPA
jgi:hypothetical protein